MLEQTFAAKGLTDITTECVAIRTTTAWNGLESRYFDAVGNAKYSLFRRQLADYVMLQGLPGDCGVAGADERQGGVASGVLQQDVLAARMTIEEICAVVHVVVDDQPAIVGRVVPSDLVQVDRAQLVARLFPARPEPACPVFRIAVVAVVLQDIVTLDLQEVILGLFHVAYLEGVKDRTQKVHIAAARPRIACSAT